MVVISARTIVVFALLFFLRWLKIEGTKFHRILHYSSVNYWLRHVAAMYHCLWILGVLAIEPFKIYRTLICAYGHLEITECILGYNISCNVGDKLAKIAINEPRSSTWRYRVRPRARWR